MRFPSLLSHLTLISVLALPLAAQVEDLSSDDPKVRAKAVESLGEKGQKAQAAPDTVCEALGKTVKDPAKEVREKTVMALIKTGSQHCQAPLRAATGDANPDIQSLAIDGLVNFYSPGYVKFGWMNSVKSFGSDLKNRFKEEEPLVVPLSVPVAEEDIAAIAKKITGGSSMESRANAARAAGILRGKQAIPELLKALESPDKEVAIESIRALNKIRDVSVGERMTGLLASGDQDVQVEAAETLGNLRTKEAVPGLEQLVRSGKKDVKRAALTALAKIPDNGQEKLFLLYLRDKDENLRAAAAEGLGRGGDDSDLAELQDAFAQEKKETARLSMAFAAVHLGDLGEAAVSGRRVELHLPAAGGSSVSGRAGPRSEGAVRALHAANFRYPRPEDPPGVRHCHERHPRQRVPPEATDQRLRLPGRGSGDPGAEELAGPTRLTPWTRPLPSRRPA